MDSARWERMQALFHEAAERPAAERRAFLEAACGGDDALVADVLALLEEDARARRCWIGTSPRLRSEMLGRAGCAVAARQRNSGLTGSRRLLGEGGMGVVYLAEREDLGSLVAIKILRDAWMSPARRERFAQ